ncbi:hypothetical protein [Luteipulveratus mongoliensis]|uniref:Uncharacterized protein n=1 Tax=Luteipulveratus mongoliensis TaxID=571913 RepID=A0A0K1JGA9_9MICO|nr:hypothetical protein [Luteipulveratus mongoliensis]AKU15734.1 hypothetical protein VV02_07515 [Luteipulveratus mongoliensis]
MPAAAIRQSTKGDSDSSGITTADATFPSSVVSGNTAIVMFAGDAEPTTVPSGFTSVASFSGNFVYKATAVTGTTFTFGWSSPVRVAWAAVEFVGVATFGTPETTASGSPGTTAVGPEIDVDAGNIRVLSILFAGYQAGVPGAVTAWADDVSDVADFVSIINSDASTAGGAFNYLVSVSSALVEDAGSYSTTATLSATTYWTHGTVALTFPTAVPDPDIERSVFNGSTWDPTTREVYNGTSWVPTTLEVIA